jgi:hypothetical protein
MSQQENRRRWLNPRGKLFLACAMVLAGTGVYFTFGPEKPPLGRGEIVCPLGHTTMRTVEVLYGYPIFNKEDDNKLDRGEAVTGGCVIFKESPAYNGICTQCGYRYDPHTKNWTQSTEDFSKCRPPMMPIISALALPEPSSQNFFQWIHARRALQESAFLKYEREPLPSAEQLFRPVEAYLAEREIVLPIAPLGDVGAAQGSTYRSYRWIENGVKFDVWVSWEKFKYIRIELEAEDMMDFLEAEGEKVKHKRPDYPTVRSMRGMAGVFM